MRRPQALASRAESHYKVPARAMDSIEAAVSNVTGSPGAMVGGTLGAVIDFEEKAADGLFDFLDKAPEKTKESTSAMSDAWAGFYNDTANGFANLFMNFRLTTEGFASFFIGVWEEIRRAFFKIIGQIIAKWLVINVLFKAIGFVVPGLKPGLDIAAKGIMGMAEGFQGVISKPTLTMIGERGPEYVSVTPMGGGATGAASPAGGVTLNLYAPMISTTGISRRDAEEAADILFAAVNNAARRRGFAIG